MEASTTQTLRRRAGFRSMQEIGEWSSPAFRLGHVRDHTEAGLAEMRQLADDVVAALR